MGMRGPCGNLVPLLLEAGGFWLNASASKGELETVNPSPGAHISAPCTLNSRSFRGVQTLHELPREEAARWSLKGPPSLSSQDPDWPEIQPFPRHAPQSS